MAKKDEQVALNRGGEPGKNRRWPLVLGVILLVGVIGVAAWLFAPRYMQMFEPEATQPPTLDAGTSGQVIYQTSFDTIAAFEDWQLFDGGSISAAAGDGQLVVTVNALEDTGTWSGSNFTLDDFVLAVAAEKLDGADDNGISVIFRLHDENNFNRFDISSDGFYSLTAVRDGVAMVVSDWRRSPVIQQGNTVNQLRVMAQGDTFVFEVNGTQMPLCISDDPAVGALWDPTADEPTCLGGEVTDSWVNGDLASGRVGLGAQGFTGFDGETSTAAYAVIAFDEVVITTP